ncbi:MAG: hypothetical protein AAF603_11200 [Pseudomonadota bacterium]
MGIQTMTFDTIIAVFSTPLGGVILTLSLLAIVAILFWAFGQRQIPPTTPEIEQTKASMVPPPLLSPDIFKGGTSALLSPERGLRPVFILVGVVLAGLSVLHMTSKEPPQTQDPFTTDSASVMPTMIEGEKTFMEAYAQPNLHRIICEEGFIPETQGNSYRLCASRQAAQLDMMGFAVDDQPLLNPHWLEGSGLAMVADNQPTPFSFEGQVEMVAAPDANLNDYDAFLAIGMATPETTIERAAHESVERSFTMGRYALSSLRQGAGIHCQSDATVYAISLPSSSLFFEETAATKPILVGVRFDPRFSQDDRNVTALIDDFFSSRGVEMTGLGLQHTDTYQILFSEKACKIHS